MINTILRTLKDYQELPNVPFLTKYTVGFVASYLTKINRPFENNPYGIIVPPKNIDPAKPKLVIIAHLDHPGIVLKKNHEGIFFGLGNLANLKNIVDKKPIAIKIHNPQGKFQGIGQIISVDLSPKQLVSIKTDLEVQPNSFGQFDLDYYQETKDYVSVYNADDGVNVAILLELIKNYKNDGTFNVYFVFAVHEEVHQLSSWRLAKKNYFELTNTDLVLNLECKKIININPKIAYANYENGVVLQLSNNGCLFGYQNPGKNKTESLVRYVTNALKTQLQIGVIKGSCDSRPFTQFKLTPNIATLSIPNRYKHNGADTEDSICLEEIIKQDIEDQYTILNYLISSKIDLDKLSLVPNLSEELKKSDKITSLPLMKSKAKLNRRLDIAYRSKVADQRYFPVNIGQMVMDFYYKILSYLQYFLQF